MNGEKTNLPSFRNIERRTIGNEKNKSSNNLYKK